MLEKTFSSWKMVSGWRGNLIYHLGSQLNFDLLYNTSETTDFPGEKKDSRVFENGPLKMETSIKYNC